MGTATGRTPQGAEGTGHHIWGRRGLLTAAGWASILACLATGVVAWFRMMFPRVLFEPPTSFRAGRPEEYPAGGVYDRFLADQRVWIVRVPEGFFAVVAVCTHLGCAPRWLAAEDRFKCPCHGSGFKMDGTNFEGPAPRPLEHAMIALGDDGQLVVDKSVRFRADRGEWELGGLSERPGAFLRWPAA